MEFPLGRLVPPLEHSYYANYFEVGGTVLEAFYDVFDEIDYDAFGTIITLT